MCKCDTLIDGNIDLCRYVIYVKEGTYEEQLTVTKKMVNLTIYGDGSQKTMVTGNKNLADGVRIYDTATFGTFIHYVLISSSRFSFFFFFFS